jgi:hypothetical protein
LARLGDVWVLGKEEEGKEELWGGREGRRQR